MTTRNTIIVAKGSLIGLALCATLFTSCRFEDDDYFDQSAALRIESTVDDIQKTLVGAENGWVIQYFTGTDEVEGFNILARFENSQKVTMAGNHRFLRNDSANKYTEYVSLYEVLKEDGPVLAFNTWNDVLTPLVDPVDPSVAPGSLVKDGEGMKGDHNLVVLSYGPEEILLRGERHSAQIRMIPCDKPWEEYLASVTTMKNYFTNTTIPNYYVIGPNADTLYFKGLRSGVITYCERITDPLFPSTINCLFTPQGFRLHHPNDIKGTAFQEFHIAPDSTCLVSEDDSVRVISLWDNYIVNTRSAVWYLNQEQLTEGQKNLLQQLDNELKKVNKNYSFASIGLGRSSGNKAVKGLVVTFYTNTAKTKTNTAGLALNTSRPAFGQMTIEYDESMKVDGNLETIAKKSDGEAVVRQLAATLIGTYDMVPDNYFMPTGCQLKGTSITYALSSK